MKNAANIPLVTTIGARCRVCYTCVRECPAKAIRIADGRAGVVPERCIGCGNCVRVCSQQAKLVVDDTNEVAALLAREGVKTALLAPSFPAEFTDIGFTSVVGMLRKLGFTHVYEAAFGADLVAESYRALLARDDKKRYISTTCPAIVAYVERYHPDLVERLAPVVSPMVAMARVIQRIHGEGTPIVFIGPCIAKKGEAASVHLRGEVNEALTFTELRRMFAEHNVRPSDAEPGDFDPPCGGLGGLFPVSRGLLQAAQIAEDLIDGAVVAADGRAHFVEAIKEFESGDLDVRLLEVLACNGCINGPGVTNEQPLFSRRRSVGRFVRMRMNGLLDARWRQDLARYATLDLGRAYAVDDQRIPAPSERELRKILWRLGKTRLQDELNCGACGYDTCREHAFAIYKGLAEHEMCLPYVIDQFRKTLRDLAASNDQLAQTREALVQSERLASMGQLAAGIAHELNNPLGVVLMYAHLLKDDHEGDEKMHEDLDMIAEQADRCKKIVMGLLDFARQNKLDLEPIDVRDLVDRARKACPAPEGITVDVRHEGDETLVPMDRDQMLQVMTNLIGNAYGAMPRGGTLTIRTSSTPTQVKLSVSDTGVGIPPEHRDKVFEPFFTTKEVGKGTGLGLAVTYGIVKMHRGGIAVESNHDPAQGPTGTTFTVSLPRNGDSP